MRIYIDTDYRCRVESGAGLRAVETDFFDGRCRAFIEGYRLIPQGETWTDADGRVICGRAVFPWRDYALLAEFQRQFEEILAERVDVQSASIAPGGADDDER